MVSEKEIRADIVHMIGAWHAAKPAEAVGGGIKIFRQRKMAISLK